MSRLIDAERFDVFDYEEKEDGTFTDGVMMVLEAIDNAPTIEPCEDAISIEVAIQTVWMILNGMGYPKDQNEDLAQTIKAVFDTAPRVAPSRPSGEWIPFSERMPEDPSPSFTYGSKTYQVTTASGKVVALSWQKTKVRGKTVMRWEWSDGVIYHGDALAWKPLSEPWKGADDE